MDVTVVWSRRRREEAVEVETPRSIRQSSCPPALMSHFPCLWLMVTPLVHDPNPLSSITVPLVGLACMIKSAAMLTVDRASTTSFPEPVIVDNELIFREEEESIDWISCKLIEPPHVTFEADEKFNGCPMRSMAFPTPYVKLAPGKVRLLR